MVISHMSRDKLRHVAGKPVTAVRLRFLTHLPIPEILSIQGTALENRVFVNDYPQTKQLGYSNTPK